MEASNWRQRNPTDSPPGPALSVGSAELVAALEAIRASVHRWLDTIEEHLDDDRLPSASRDHETVVRELERQRGALQAEIDRREREWAERLDALEHDRRLLAEAWERLEQAEVAAVPPNRSSSERPLPASTTPPSRVSAPSIDPVNPVDRAVLRQFETLRRDVRREAEAQDRP